MTEIIKHNKSHKDILDIMEIISAIRSTKAELNITPKLYCDVYISKKSKLSFYLFKNYAELIKQVGRIENVFDESNKNTNTIEILVLKEKIKLKFNNNVDIESQKSKIKDKINVLSVKITSLDNKLKNQGYLMNAPKHIVQNDRDLLADLIIEENKLRSIVSSIN